MDSQRRQRPAPPFSGVGEQDEKMWMYTENERKRGGGGGGRGGRMAPWGEGRLRWMRAAAVPVLVLLMSASVRGQLGGGQPLISTAFVTGETALCCTRPDFGNADTAPELQPCRQWCRAFVPYNTLQSCQMNMTCVNAMRDIEKGIELATQRLSDSTVCTSTDRVCFPGIACEGGICQPPPNPMTVSCELSLRRGICGYHFPVCVSDQVTISHELCAEVCQDIRDYCNLTLPEVTATDLCSDRNFGCTSGTGRLSAAFPATVAAAAASLCVAAWAYLG